MQYFVDIKWYIDKERSRLSTMHAASFCVLFPNYQSFNVQTVSALVKTLVMMAGEIEYENFIYENGEAIFPFTGHFMILLFVVLISIILMNLLVGLAVSDIQVDIFSLSIFINGVTV